MRDPFHSDQRIGRVKAPLLFMHGARDRTIPIGFGERLFALAHEPKQFVRFPDGGHNDLDDFGATANGAAIHWRRGRRMNAMVLHESRFRRIQGMTA